MIIASIFVGIFVLILGLAAIDNLIRLRNERNEMDRKLRSAQSDAQYLVLAAGRDRSKVKGMTEEMRRIVTENTQLRRSHIKVPFNPMEVIFRISDGVFVRSPDFAERAVRESMHSSVEALKRKAEDERSVIMTDINVTMSDHSSMNWKEYRLVVGIMPRFSYPNKVAEFQGVQVLPEVDESLLTEVDEIMTRWSPKAWETPKDPPPRTGSRLRS